MIRILRLLVPASILAMFICETVLIYVSYVAAVYLHRDPDPQTFLIDQSGWISIAATTALILLGMHLRQLYSGLRIRSRILLLQDLSLGMGAMFVAEALMTYFASSLALPRNVLLTGSGFALASVYAWRIFFSAAVRNRLGLQRVLFIGFPPSARILTGFLARHPEIGFTPVGYLDESDAGPDSGAARLGSPEDLEKTVERHRPEWIVIGARTGVAAPHVDDLVALRFGGIQIEDVESFFERTTGRANAAGILPSEPLFPEGLLPNPMNAKYQSIYATLAVLAAIPVAIPLLAAIALSIRLSSRGPVFVRERRIGLCGVPFTMYRFRSGPEGSGIGAWAARWGLDRLPQIGNVLRGEMSLVGPEADRPEFAGWLSRSIPFYRWRVLMHPGVIGWAQIHKASDGYGFDAIRRLEYDLYYLKNVSPLLDLFILLRWFRDALPFSESGEA